MNVIDSDILERMIDIRRDLHRQPELSWHEDRGASLRFPASNSVGVKMRWSTTPGAVSPVS